MAEQIDDEWVADRLAECLSGIMGFPSPDEDAVAGVTRRINQYIASPWTEAEITKLRSAAKNEREEMVVLEKAADILRRDLAGWQHLSEARQSGTLSRRVADDRIAAYETTIATLHNRRGWLTSPGLAMRLSDKGPAPAPWALMAAGIADEVHRVLRDCSDRRDGIGGPNGPITRFIAACLALLVEPGDSVPANSTIHEALRLHLNQSLAYRA